MSDSRVCKSCGANNLASARWCNQCYTSFEAAAAEPAVVTPPVPPPLPTPDTAYRQDDHVSRPPAPAEPGSGQWACGSCGVANPIEENSCSACGTSIFESFGATVDAPPAISAGEAIRYALLPGLAHGRLGHSLWGATIAILIGTLWLIGILFILAEEQAIGLMFVLMAVAVLGVSMHDAVKLANGASEETLLKPRIITIVAGVAIVLAIVVVGTRGTPAGTQ